ncbi:hypothetical protein SO802_028329 [Lithocarpus litseifolius]|uniref:Uncharacterized protein n=1 Tax=Lithocarpus litseifolius TaxID=425828 RepID=A0AAW2BT44_9ROSI
MGNFPMIKLFQILTSVQSCDLQLCCKEDIVGILKYMVVWKLNWVEAELGSFQGLTEAIGMEHDGDNIDDA